MKNIKTYITRIIIGLTAIFQITCGGGGGGGEGNSTGGGTSPPDTINNNLVIIDKGAQYLNETLKSSSFSDALKFTVSFLQKEPTVVHAEITPNGKGVYIEYKSGLKAIIDAVSYKRNDIPLFDKTSLEQSALPREEQFPNGLSNLKAIVMESASSMDYDGPEALTTLLRQNNYTVAYKKDSEVTPLTFTNLNGYKVIYFNGHGSVDIDGRVAISTGEEYSDSQKTNYDKQGYNCFNTMLACRSKDDTKTYFCVTSDFISRFSKDLTAGIVYMDSCETMKNNSMASSFTQNGSKAFAGWDAKVADYFSGMRNTLISVFDDMLKGEELSKAIANAPFNWNSADLKYNGDGSAKLNPPSTFLTNIPVGGSSFGLALSPNGDRLYVSSSVTNLISEIGTGNNSPIGKPIPAGSRPFDLVVTPDGQYFYGINHELGGAIQKYRSNMSPDGQPIQICGQPRSMTISPKGDYIYVACENSPGGVSVINTSTNAHVRVPISENSLSQGVAVSTDGRFLYVNDMHNDRVAFINTALIGTLSNPVINQFSVGRAPHFIVFAPTLTGDRLYVTNYGDGTVSVIDAYNGSPIGGPIYIGPQPIGMARTPDGNFVYALSTGNGTVSIISADTNELVGAPISVGGSPWKVIVHPSGDYVYVANRTTTVSVIGR